MMMIMIMVIVFINKGRITNQWRIIKRLIPSLRMPVESDKHLFGEGVRLGVIRVNGA